MPFSTNAPLLHGPVGDLISDLQQAAELHCKQACSHVLEVKRHRRVAVWQGQGARQRRCTRGVVGVDRRQRRLERVLGAGVVAGWQAAVVEGDAAHAACDDRDDAVDGFFSKVDEWDDTCGVTQDCARSLVWR